MKSSSSALRASLATCKKAWHRPITCRGTRDESEWGHGRSCRTNGRPAGGRAPGAGTPRAGGSRELLTLALPLVVSQGFMTVQVFVDTILLAWHDPREMAASFPAVMWFWLVFGLLQVTAGYVSTFVAQYTGAGRPERVGPAVWQGIHFSVLAGLLFLLMVPASPYLIAVGGHTPALQALEVVYLRCLCFAALPMLVMAAVNGFFSGRGQTWIVLGIEAAGTAVNVALALVLIFGRAGFPELGIAGAGWATVTGSWTSALLALSLLLRRKYRAGIPNSQWVAAGAGIVRPAHEVRRSRRGAGVPRCSGIQRVRPACRPAGRSRHRGHHPGCPAEHGGVPADDGTGAGGLDPGRPAARGRPARPGRAVGLHGPEVGVRLYVRRGRGLPAHPGRARGSVRGDRDPESFAAVAKIVPTLLACVAVYSLADAVNVTFSFALRGAGDTRFVSLLTFALAWPIMVVPTFVVVRTGAASTRRGYSRRRTSSPWPFASSCGSAPANGKACG